MTDTGTATKTRVRSPGFPFIGLKKAIVKAQEFYDREKRNWANVKVASKHWGFNENSSGSKQTIAALIAYGLLQSSGSGRERQVRISDSALNILLDKRDGSAERQESIEQAALRPKLHREIWGRYSSRLPSDDNLRDFLVRVNKPPFNENWVDHFIGEFRATLAFAKLDGSDTISEDSEDTSDHSEEQGQMQAATQIEHRKPPPGTSPSTEQQMPTQIQVPVFLTGGRAIVAKVDFGEPVLSTS